jgi:MFS family permease
MLTTEIPQSKAVGLGATRKIVWRLLPFIVLAYLVNYTDRAAVAFAAPAGMNDDLQMTATMFGLASGIFFIGYILLEVPSNLLMQKFGARKWLSRIMVSWGIVASLTAFVQTYEQLLIMRFLLGVAEAGFAPAIVLYLTYWFSNKNRVKAISIFLLGIPVSSVITAPVVTWLIAIGNSMSGVTGWRFMIFIVGLPAVVLGVVAFFYLTDRPSQAKWLTQAEKDSVLAEIDSETDVVARHNGSIKAALRNPMLWLVSIAYLCLAYGLYAVTFFVPGLVASFSTTFGTAFTPFQSSLIIAVPYAFAAVAMVLWARSSAKRRDVGWHVLMSSSLGAIGILIAAFSTNPLLIMIGVTFCTVGVISSFPVLWGLPTKILTGVGAAAGLALYNTVGNFGGFAGPFFTGWLKDLTGSNHAAFSVLAGFLFLSGLLAVYVQRRNRRDVESAKASDARPEQAGAAR